MRGLLEFSNRPNVRDVVSRLAHEKQVQGVVAEYQGLWHQIRYADSSWHETYRYWRRFGPLPFPPPWVGPDGRGRSLGRPLEEVRLAWSELSDGGEPYQLRVCLIPGASDDLPKSLSDIQTDFPIVFEERPIARLTFSRGLRARAATDRGTIGGAIKSSKGGWLGITCGHVVEASPTVYIDELPDSLLSRLATIFGGRGRSSLAGECVERTAATELVAGTACNPYTPNAGSSNALDIALIKADFSERPILKWEGPPAPRASAASGQAASMVAVDGVRQGELGGIGIYYVLRDSQNRAYCFGGLFELLAPRYAPKIVHHGDSGAWVMRHGPTGDEWYGMVLGSDELRGFAMFAEPIFNWIQGKGLA